MRRAAWALAVWPWGMPAARPAPEADSLAVAKLRDFNAQRGCAGAVCTVKLFFVHLHKCGGTTVESYFRQAYGDAFLVPDTGHEGELRDALVVQNKARIRALRAFARPYRVFARHIAYGYHATVDCARPLYMTMLREPTARLLSLYGYLMFGEGKKYRRFPANATFGEFVRHRTTGTCAESTGGVYQEYCLSNYQTRKICGYYAILETAEPSEETFRCAARHIDLFFFVGTVERMQESLCALGHLLQWRFSFDAKKKLNPSAHAATTDEDLEHLVRWDRKLWHLGDRHLDETLRGLPAGTCAPPAASQRPHLKGR